MYPSVGFLDDKFKGGDFFPPKNWIYAKQRGVNPS